MVPRLFVPLIVLVFWVPGSLAQAQAQPIEINEALAVRASAGRGGARTLISTDAVVALLAKGDFPTPKAGDTLNLPNGQTATWQKAKADKDGVFQAGGGVAAGSYVFYALDVPEPAVMLLEASGDSIAFVNGVPHTGDPYSYGYLRIPVSLKKGENQLLVSSARGRLRIRLLPVRADATIDVADPTLPDVLLTDREPLLGAVVVQNNTDKELRGLKLGAKPQGAADALVTALPAIPPLSIRKVPFRLQAPAKLEGEKLPVALELQGAAGKLDAADVTLRVRKPLQTHKRTFVSGVDGSVQYYAVNPAQKPSGANALVLSLHGASVEALGQADAYAGKDWATIVAPTNRRPYGFDWEDIGQLDALEVLAIAEKSIPHDPRRVVLTGHSMGGHGTWHVGLTFPDRFAAIGPSAGWSSFASYGGGRGGRGGAATQPSKVQQLLATANAPGDTLSLVRNSLSQDVYILHGDADDNVPVREARLMRAALQPFHPRLGYHEEPGAGHWWGGKCVDWPAMFEVFDKVRLPADGDVNEVEFTTANPAQSARFHWAVVEQQEQPLRPSTLKLSRKEGRITGTTKNVAMLKFELSALGGVPKGVELDGRAVDLSAVNAGARELVLSHGSKGWATVAVLDPNQKSAVRGSAFVTAFNHRMVFVYGTGGGAAAAASDAYNTARQLAEALYYRGNGAVDVVADSAFRPADEPDRNVILFGNADSNGAWAALMGRSPVQTRQGSVHVGATEIKGDDLGVLCIAPRPGSASALVAAVASTGHAGAVAIERLPLLVSGVGIPDWAVVSADGLTSVQAGVRAAGYFGNDWSLEKGESVIGN